MDGVAYPSSMKRFFLVSLVAGVLGLAHSAQPLQSTPGSLATKPDGSPFLVDVNQSGTSATPQVSRVTYGRLVDVHDVDAAGVPSAQAVMREFVIDPNVQSDGVNYLLETNPVTQATRLVILHPFNPAGGPFLDALKQAESNLVPILPKSDDPSELPPFSLLPRNAALIVQVDDLLDDSASAVASLAEDVRLFTGYPPSVPYPGVRAFFDPNHGDVVHGAFHSTRVIVDLAVSELEASMGATAPVNLLGLPASDSSSTSANVSLRIPTQVDPSSGQFTRLTNLTGVPLDPGGDPVDLASPTQDLVRAMRSGNETDASAGFLLDLEAPRLLGQWPVQIVRAHSTAGGSSGFDFTVKVAFQSACQATPQPGDVLQLAGRFLEVTAAGTAVSGGSSSAVGVRLLAEDPVHPRDLLGSGTLILPYGAGVVPGHLEACWLTFSPQPGLAPGTDVQPASQVQVRFSEPMAAKTLTAFDGLVLTRDVTSTPDAHDLVVAEVLTSADQTSFVNTPLLPLSHTAGTAETYRVWLGGSTQDPTDLVGNPLTAKPRLVTFQLDPSAPTGLNGGFALRFSDTDEVRQPAEAAGEPDLRGQILYDFQKGVIRPRPVTRLAAVADRTQLIPSFMTPFATGVSTPLSPLGARMMSVWRYTDVGFSTEDESNHNVDVEGLAWSPIGGAVVSDFFPEFEIRLAHGSRLPDEHIDLSGSLLPFKPLSGLDPAAFDLNILSDPAGLQATVHAKALGYSIDPVDLFTSSTGTTLLPYPLNRSGGPYESYTWRDTAIQAEAGPSGFGIDLGIMEYAGFIPPASKGLIAPAGQVPSIGLPLLMEFRCWPADTAVGLNALDVSFAIPTSVKPTFRVFSAGGISTAGLPVLKDPDLEAIPSGGFNPGSVPPGAPTRPDDNVFYIGQMDLVTRVSRAHSAWIDTQPISLTTFLDPVIDPRPGDMPAGTEVVLAWRGATSLAAPSGPGSSGYAFDADRIDPYGAIRNSATGSEYLGDDGDVTFVLGTGLSWTSDLATLNGARYLQLRLSFIGNTQTLETAELSGLGVAYDLP